MLGMITKNHGNKVRVLNKAQQAPQGSFRGPKCSMPCRSMQTLGFPTFNAAHHMANTLKASTAANLVRTMRFVTAKLWSSVLNAKHVQFAGLGDERNAISAFLFTWPDGDTSKAAVKLPKVGNVHQHRIWNIFVSTSHLRYAAQAILPCFNSST
jgi:hypothetical protein